MDAIGGHMNAATSKLYTAYYAKVCDSDLEKAADILADIVCHPLITQEDLEKRKKASSPKRSPWSTITLKRMCLTCFMRHSIMDRLAMPIIGTREGVLGYTRQQVVDYPKAHYNADNTVISVAGSFKREELIAILEDKFSGWEEERQQNIRLPSPTPPPAGSIKDKKSEQTHICPGVRGSASR